MDPKEVKIEEVNVKDLYTFACQISRQYEDKSIIPITEHRALAQTKNPYADENDVGLLVAYIGKKCIGYIGILPGLLKIEDRFSKVYFPSTLYVTPEYRRYGIGKVLVLHSMALNYDLVFTGVSESADRLYRKLNLYELESLEYSVIDFNRVNIFLFASLLLKKILKGIGIRSIVSDKAARISRVLFSSFKKLLYRIVLSGQEKRLDEISYREVSKIHEEDMRGKDNAQFIEFHRNASVINWMLQFKWVEKRDEEKLEDLDYYFSSVRESFKFIALKVFSSDEKDSKGFLVLSVSSNNLNTELKLLDFYCSDHADFKYIFSLVLKYARIHNADSIVLPDSLNRYIKSHKFVRLLIRRRKRTYFLYPKNEKSPLATLKNKITLNYCDGDTPFT
jgi:GNAT superfamily N-acetyltransferase